MTIVFISNLKDPNQKMSSTDIMTRNILAGLAKTNNTLIILALVDSETNINEIQKYYIEYSDKIIFLPRVFHENQSRYFFVVGSIYNQLFKKYYKHHLKTIYDELESVDLIISNKITIDEIVYGKILKKKNPHAQFLQYWSDPLTLSGICIKLLKKMPPRWLFFLIEKMAISGCDRIIYGTKPLAFTQCQLFKKFKKKISYINVSFSDEYNKDCLNKKNENRLLYAGNYYSTIRDISPLVHAISLQNKYYLDVYGEGDFDFHNMKNITVHPRIEKKKFDIIEKDYQVSICILNKKTSQIPGKIFYDMNSKKRILVLVDGPNQDLILSYLNEFKRFELCKNTVEDIKDYLNNRQAFSIDYDYVLDNYSPEKVAKELINGGLNL